MSYKAYGGVHNVLNDGVELSNINSANCHDGQLITIRHDSYNAIYSYDSEATAKILLCRLGDENPDTTGFPTFAVTLYGSGPVSFVEADHLGDGDKLFIAPQDIQDGGDYTDVPGRWVAVNYVMHLYLLASGGGGGSTFNNWTETAGGHLLPNADDTYDIGSAEFKIRDLYVSDSTIWMGGKTRLRIEQDGELKVEKIVQGKVPKGLQEFIELNIGPDYVAAVNSVLGNSPGDPIPNGLTMKQWLSIANSLGMNAHRNSDLLDDIEDFVSAFGDISALSAEFGSFKTTMNASLAAKIGNAELTTGLNNISLASLGGITAATAEAAISKATIAAEALDVVSKIDAAGFMKPDQFDTVAATRGFAKSDALTTIMDSKVAGLDIETAVLGAGFAKSSTMANLMDTKIGSQDLSGFATVLALNTAKTEAIASATQDLSGYASLGAVDSKIAGQDFSAFASKTYADNKVAALDIESAVLNAGFAKSDTLTSLMDTKVASIDVESVALSAGFAKSSTMANLMDTKVAAGTAGLIGAAGVQQAIAAQDFSTFATKTYADNKVASIDVESAALSAGFAKSDTLTSLMDTKIGAQDFTGFASSADIDSKIAAQDFSSLNLNNISAFNNLKTLVDNNDTLLGLTRTTVISNTTTASNALSKADINAGSISTNSSAISEKTSGAYVAKLAGEAGFATTSEVNTIATNKARTEAAAIDLSSYATKTQLNSLEDSVDDNAAQAGMAASAAAQANSYFTGGKLNDSAVNTDLKADLASIASETSKASGTNTAVLSNIQSKWSF